MKAGKRWSIWKPSAVCPLLALAMFTYAPGCAKNRTAVEKTLMAQQFERNVGVPQAYRAGCPDVIELDVSERSEFTGRYEIGTDGRINLGDYGKPRIEGRTPAEIAALIGAEIGVDKANVLVQVKEHKSQHILLFGEVTGLQRSIPYRGPETVLDLLQRVGGITPGAAPNDVYVVRPHIGDNLRPELFHVDLAAIVMKQDHRTNLRVEPFDQIFIGETRRSKIDKAIPPLLRGAYHVVWPPARSLQSEGPNRAGAEPRTQGEMRPKSD